MGNHLRATRAGYLAARSGRSRCHESLVDGPEEEVLLREQMFT